MEFEFSDQDNLFMREAVNEAIKARENGEVPIGAVIVLDGEIIGRGRNDKAERKVATAHAEIMAIEDASRHLKDWRLEDCTMYVTLEPCLMCAGAIVHTRMKEVVYGVSEPKFGGVDTLTHTFDLEGMNHRVERRYGLFAEEISGMMKEFFRELRKKNSK